MRIFVSSLTVLILAAGFAMAQARDLVHVHLPYAVQAAGNTIPAGDYEIRDIDTSGDIPMLLVHSSTFNAVIPAMRVTISNDQLSDKSDVVLAKTETGYTLEHLRIEGRTYRYDFR